MSRLNFLILAALSSAFLLAEHSTPANLNPIVGDFVATDAGKEIASMELTDRELEQYYSLYKGAYYWAHDFDLDGANDFGYVLDKMRVVRDHYKLGETKFTDYAYNVLKKYEGKDQEGLDFSQENIDNFANDCYMLSEGIKNALQY